MQRLFFLILLFTFSVHATFSQSPYHFNWKKESSIAGLGLSTLAASYYLGSEVEPFSPDQLSAFDRSNVIGFDRVATYNNSISAQKTSDVLSLGSKMLPVVLLAGKETRHDFTEIAALYAETFLVANGLTTFTKSAVTRPRPFVFNEEIPVADKLDKEARYSFFSGHTSKTAAMTFFTAKVYSDYYPDSKWKPVVWTAAAAIPAVTGYMRVKGGKHYPSDVMVGYVVGALSGILVPQLHKQNPAKAHKLDNVDFRVGLASANLRVTF